MNAQAKIEPERNIEDLKCISSVGYWGEANETVASGSPFLGGSPRF